MTTTLRDVHVERDDDGVLVVDWSSDRDVAVDVGVGASPTVTEHIVVTTVTSTTGVRLDGLGHGRRYVSLTPSVGHVVVTAERRVPFVGITNLRDLGGYTTTGSGTTRWGRVFRADALHKLTPADLETFRDLGVRTVYDLRSDLERADFPGPVESLHTPILGRPADAPVRLQADIVTNEDGETMLRDTYVGILEHSAAQIGTILRGLADRTRVPAVFHCHGGKDRTGVVAAVLLLALGVARSTVLDDYEATRRYRTFEDQQDGFAAMLAAGVAPEAAAGALGTPRWAMDEAVDAIDTVYGGIDRYLTERAGLTANELTPLREQLIEPAPRT